MQTLVFATNNAHKAREVEQILGPGYTVIDPARHRLYGGNRRNQHLRWREMRS
jgi:inosine/xanthosine triphosphate pyrophosphatase family protein